MKCRLICRDRLVCPEYSLLGSLRFRLKSIIEFINHICEKNTFATTLLNIFSKLKLFFYVSKYAEKYKAFQRHTSALSTVNVFLRLSLNCGSVFVFSSKPKTKMCKFTDLGWQMPCEVTRVLEEPSCRTSRRP